LRKKFTGQPEHVVNYLFMVAEETREHMSQLGFRTIRDMVGRSDCIEMNDAIRHWKGDGLDLSNVLKPASKPYPDAGVYNTKSQDHGLEKSLDMTRLLGLSEKAIARGEAVHEELPIVNTNRTVGTILSHHLVKAHGEQGLPDDTIHFKFRGSAGQSFGAFLARGITLELEGDANDYVGKGLSGGRLMVYPPRESQFAAESNIIVGNVCLYGATSGHAYIRGRAAERFAVRNSGALAVVEGVGDHGCEYMTGGRVVILGRTGRNFAAGMSGGVAFVWDETGSLNLRCNLGLVELEPVALEKDQNELRQLIESHVRFTDSAVGHRILGDWERSVMDFVKVMPRDYKRVLVQRGELPSDTVVAAASDDS